MVPFPLPCLPLTTLLLVLFSLCLVMQVPVIDGEAEISVKEGTQPGSILRLRNRGVPKLMSGDSSQRGDHYFTVRPISICPLFLPGHLCLCCQ